MKKTYFFIFLLAIAQGSIAQDQPKLVVGIVVDQMRQEYLYRFENKFGENGFKRLMNNGFMLTNMHYNYVPTFTAPGHSSVYTGSTPAVHGIISNDWWDKDIKKKVNCVGDDRQKPVGSTEGNGDVSPWRLLSTTVTDELKLFTQKKSKVIGISIKDRGAVLPAGHFADAAYWFESSNGKFISSTYYFNTLPGWVEAFNTQKLPDTYINKVWNPLLPIAQYTESGPDDSPYEKVFKGKDKAVFPYDLSKLHKENDGFDLLYHTPFGNDLLTDFAMAALKAESLGKHEVTDFFTISFSSPDYVGHNFGPNSVEIEDTYIRLDKNIETLLAKLDEQVGKDNYVVFLTADHAVEDVPQSLKDAKLPAGYLSEKALSEELNAMLQKNFPGKNLVESVTNQQVFLNADLFTGEPKIAGVDLMIATDMIVNYLQKKEGVALVYTRTALKQGDYNEGGSKGMIIRGFNHRRSGDIVFELEPAWLSSSSKKGTSHGTSYTYDTHVPALFYGKGINKGSSAVRHQITDIAPTISVLLKIKYPSGCTGNPITEIVDNK
ncbi:MAG: alkaline phosphatase family protein [Bacteroidetes bacterium]|nr:alkaline phosphatase family protein [Bacteroidota bacterium]